MKLAAGKIAAFLRDPGTCRVVLLHGEDGGLIRDRAEALVRLVAGSLDDPFRVAELDRDGVPRIAEEMASRPMTGGRRVVRVRDVTDGAAGVVQSALASKAEGLVILEAGELTGRSKLRSVVEAAPDGVAIACYSEQGAELAQTIATVLRDCNLAIDPEASAYLADHLGNDRGTTRRELEKLALYAYPATSVDLDAATTMVGDMAGLQLDDALYAATRGDGETADRALGLALGEGATPVSMLRATLSHLHRLERVQLAMQGGESATEAVRSMRPPVFFRRQPALADAARLWSAENLASACRRAFATELACKQTGAPAALLCRQLLAEITRHAAGKRRR